MTTPLDAGNLKYGVEQEMPNEGLQDKTCLLLVLTVVVFPLQWHSSVIETDYMVHEV